MLYDTKIMAEIVLKLKIHISSYPQINFKTVKIKEASIVNGGHLKFCFVSAARIASQEYRIVFSNQKSKIFYP